MRPSSSIGNGSRSASPSSTSSPASSRASMMDSSVAGFSTSSTTTFEAESSMPVSAFQSTWMSSPERNCFLAAARTASFIASMTRSLSMPCSWQSASMFCAIDELMFVSLICPIGPASRPSQFLADVNLKVRLGYQIQRNPHLPVGSILKKHVVAIHSQQTTPKVALHIEWLPRLRFCLAACETLEIGPFVQTSFESGRRHFQRVGSMDEVLDIQNRPQMSAHFRAILVGYTVRLINEDTNNRLVLGAGYFGVNQVRAAVDCHT